MNTSLKLSNTSEATSFFPPSSAVASEGLERSLVSCPSCKSEFLIKNSLISGVQSPRFHCSKCDRVFTLDESFRFEDSIRSASRAGRIVDEVPEPPPAMSRLPLSASSQNEPLVKSSAAAVRQMAPQVEASEKEQPSTSLAFTMVHGNSSNVIAPTVPAPAASKPSRQASVSFSFKVPKTAARHVPLGAPHESPLEAEELAVPKSQLAFTFQNYRKPKITLPAFTKPEWLNFSLPSLSVPKVSEQWRGVTILGGAAVAFIFLLTVLTVVLHMSSEAAKAFSAIFAAQQEKVPPSGLAVQQSRFTPVELSTGETVYLLSGSIVNDTSQTFRDVTVQGFAFDSTGKAIRSSIGRAPSPISNTKVNSLTLNEMATLQTAATGTKAQLNPGQTANFTVVLSQPLVGRQQEGTSLKHLNQSTYYSARVYSVRGS